jgi:Papain family cysteine protease
MQFYGGGVYNDQNCKTNILQLDRAMLLVGYGVYSGQPYWLL